MKLSEGQLNRAKPFNWSSFKRWSSSFSSLSKASTRFFIAKVTFLLIVLLRWSISTWSSSYLAFVALAEWTRWREIDSVVWLVQLLSVDLAIFYDFRSGPTDWVPWHLKEIRINLPAREKNSTVLPLIFDEAKRFTKSIYWSTGNSVRNTTRSSILTLLYSSGFDKNRREKSPPW